VLVLALLGVLAAAVLLLLAWLLTGLALIFLGLLALLVLVLLILSHGSLLDHRRHISAHSPWTQIRQGSTLWDC